MTQSQFVALYSKTFPKFNEDVILNIRKNDDMVKYIDETWVEINRHIPQNMKYLGYHYDDTGRRFRELNAGKDKSNSGKKTMSIYDTAARLCVFEFELTSRNLQTGGMQTVYVECPLYIPLYVDNYHFYIHGNKYTAPYQVADAVTYTNKANTIVLKTKTRAVKLAREKRTNPISDDHGNKYIAYIYYLYLSPKKIPFLLYYFAYFGVQNTFTYFGADKYCKFFTEAPLVQEEKYIWFKFGLLHLRVDREAFDKYYNLRQFIFTALECPKKNMDLESIENVTRWKIILGSSISETNALERGKSLIKTFIISLDYRTIKNIEDLIGGSPKNNMFAIVRWLFVKFSNISSKTQSLLNKRIRVSEYLIDPFLKETYKKLYRYLSTNEKSRDINRLIDIVRCPEGLILGGICGKNRKGLTINIIRFCDAVNDNAPINSGLRYTISGPGSPNSVSGQLASSQFRCYNPSYGSRIDLFASSNSDPGVSGLFVPFAKVNMNNLTFTKDI